MLAYSVAQASLHAFKRAFISKDVLSVIVGMLEEPLSHIGVARTEEDNFSIELCLTLLRNVLNIKDPTPGMVTSLGDHYVQMHEQLVALFQDALLLDILLLLAQDVHARENAKLNLLLVEIFHCVIGDQEPGAIIATHRAKVESDPASHVSKGGPSSATKPRATLLSVLAKERNMRGTVSGQMHRCVSIGTERCALEHQRAQHAVTFPRSVAYLQSELKMGISIMTDVFLHSGRVLALLPSSFRLLSCMLAVVYVCRAMNGCLPPVSDRLLHLPISSSPSTRTVAGCQSSRQVRRHAAGRRGEWLNSKNGGESIHGSHGLGSPGSSQEDETDEHVHDR